jgi:hypothetical protein
MATVTVTPIKQFVSGETVLASTLNQLSTPTVTVSSIVNADIASAADIADGKLATISTAGKVANSATTATSANTASAIVARDANGSFIAGNVTLGGNRVGAGSTSETSNTVCGGGSPLQLLTTGTNNVAVGFDALNRVTSGTRNVAVGQESAYNTTTGPKNAAFGVVALNKTTTGESNVAIGDAALFSNITTSFNTAVGVNALNAHTTNGLNTALGYQAAAFVTNPTNTTSLGANSTVTGNNQVQLGDSATTTFAFGAVQNRSDSRDKADIRDTQLGLDFINALRPVDFKWDLREDYRPAAPVPPPLNASAQEVAAYESAKAAWIEACKLSSITHNGEHKRSRYHHGLVAQEVKAVLDAQEIDFGGFQDHKVKGGDDVLSLGYEELIAPLIKSIQQLTLRINALEASN